MSGESGGGSGAGLLAKADMLKTGCGLSLEPALVRVAGGGGGGGKTAVEPGSGEDLYVCAGDTRVAGNMPKEGSSVTMTDVRWLRGGEYGGGPRPP